MRSRTARRARNKRDFTALSATDGYVELAKEDSHFPTGTPVRLYRW